MSYGRAAGTVLAMLRRVRAAVSRMARVRWLSISTWREGGLRERCVELQPKYMYVNPKRCANLHVHVSLSLKAKSLRLPSSPRALASPSPMGGA